MIVANRLPVDRVVNADGSVDWRPSPGGLVDRHRARDARQRRRLDRLVRRHRRGRRAVRERRHVPGAGAALRPGGRGVLRRLLQRHPVAALPRRRRQARVPPRVVGRLRAGQPALRRPGRRGGRRGCHGLGARLPAPAGAGDAARGAARPDHRVLPAHPLPARRAVPAAALATAAARGPARRRPGRLPAAQQRAELRPAGPSARRPQDPPRPGLPARRPHRAGGRVPDLDRRAAASRSWPVRPPSRRARRRSASSSATPGTCCSGSTGSTTPRASTTGSVPTASSSPRAPCRSRTSSSCRSPPRPASGSSSTAGCATTSTGWSAGSTATSGRIGRPAISYLHSSYPREEMAALFRAADVCVVTPLADGMNLVAKEYVACRYDEQRAPWCSRSSPGAAGELRQAFMVNPYDINGMKDAIMTAVRADPSEQSKRMKAMRKTVAEHDVTTGQRTFLDALAGTPTAAQAVRPPGRRPRGAESPRRSTAPGPARGPARHPRSRGRSLCADLLAAADPHRPPRDAALARRRVRSGVPRGRPLVVALLGQVWGARGLLYVWDDDATPAGARRAGSTRPGGWPRCA